MGLFPTSLIVINY